MKREPVPWLFFRRLRRSSREQQGLPEFACTDENEFALVRPLSYSCSGRLIRGGGVISLYGLEAAPPGFPIPVFGKRAGPRCLFFEFEKKVSSRQNDVGGLRHDGLRVRGNRELFIQGYDEDILLMGLMYVLAVERAGWLAGWPSSAVFRPKLPLRGYAYAYPGMGKNG